MKRNKKKDAEFCLAFTFRQIILYASNPDMPAYYIDFKRCMNKNEKVSLKEPLEKSGIKSNGREKDILLYELMLIQDLVRRLRNNMAHSDIKDVIEDRRNVRVLVEVIEDNYKEYHDDNVVKIFNTESNNQKDITFNNVDIYDILKAVFEVCLNMIQNNVAILSGE